MSIFRTYLTYVRDNPKGYWFKRKLYGWGWTPVRWQGWLVLLAFVAVIVLNFLLIDSMSHSVSDTLINVIPQTALIMLGLIAVCYATGEKPHWQWGLPSEVGTSEDAL
jgi:hypothetical protein